MNCEEINNSLDAIIDGELSEKQYKEIQSHVDICEHCRHLLQREERLQASLRGLPVKSYRPGFAKHALEKAKSKHEQQKRRFWRYGIGGAMAAGVALFFVGSLFFTTPENRFADMPEITLSLDESRDVRLVLNSAANLEDATFTVQLPPNVELKGFPGRQVITWKGKLKQGKNLLVLPVMASGPVAGEMTTLIEHADKKKTFHIRMEGGELKKSRNQNHLINIA